MVPDKDAGCSLVDSCRSRICGSLEAGESGVRGGSYINTSVGVKAEKRYSFHFAQCGEDREFDSGGATGDVFTSGFGFGKLRQAADGAREHEDPGRGLASCTPLFRRGGLRRRGWSIPTRWLRRIRCPQDVLAMADFIRSTSAIVDWCAGHEAREFIVMTESECGTRSEKRAQGRGFYFVANERCNCGECPYSG